MSVRSKISETGLSLAQRFAGELTFSGLISKVGSAYELVYSISATLGFYMLYLHTFHNHGEHW